MLEGAAFYTFHLSQAEYVNISFAAVSAGFDTAFSLYSGMLPSLAHDDAGNDPLGTGGATISPTDAAPGDPGIAHYILDYATYTVSLNPIWDTPQTNLCDTQHGCDITPDQWYSDNYTPHNGYRDLLNYTSTGGLDSSGNPIHPYQGQFDALGNWSMANEDGDWSQINYITSVHDIVTPLGVNHLPTNPSNVSSYNTGTEYLNNIFLQPGDYTIAAGGAGCDYQAGQGGVPLACTASDLSGTLTYTASATPLASNAAAAVPLPASGWFLATALVGLMLPKKRKQHLYIA